jgi:hypothetical protein
MRQGATAQMHGLAAAAAAPRRAPRRAARPAAAAAAADQPSTSGRDADPAAATAADVDSFEYTYRGDDGRAKATFEQAFKGGGTGAELAAAMGGRPAPWAIGLQTSEKNFAWNDCLKARLVARVAGAALGLSAAEADARLARLAALLPDLGAKAAGMPPELVGRLLEDVDAIPARLVALKAVFPGANAAVLAMRQPALVLGFDPDHLAAVAAQLRALLPRLEIDRLVEENPCMLDVEEFMCALAEAERLLPGLDVQAALASDPQRVFSFQRGAGMIPYDFVPRWAPGDGTALGAIEVLDGGDGTDEYSAYYKD